MRRFKWFATTRTAGPCNLISRQAISTTGATAFSVVCTRVQCVASKLNKVLFADGKWMKAVPVWVRTSDLDRPCADLPKWFALPPLAQPPAGQGQHGTGLGRAVTQTMLDPRKRVADLPLSSSSQPQTRNSNEPGSLARLRMCVPVDSQLRLRLRLRRSLPRRQSPSSPCRIFVRPAVAVAVHHRRRRPPRPSSPTWQHLAVTADRSVDDPIRSFLFRRRCAAAPVLPSPDRRVDSRQTHDDETIHKPPLHPVLPSAQPPRRGRQATT